MNTVALSPYHLTTREAPAMAALLLAGRVCTVLPVPLRGESIESVREALNHSPRYRRLLANWLALAPLFEAGIITTLAGADDPIAQVRASADRIGSEEPWDPIRVFARRELFGDADQYLDAFSADLLKGGPDPGIALPVCAGLDAFAVDHGFPVVRAGHAAMVTGRQAGQQPGSVGSLAQQAEARLGEQLFSVGIPILKQAGARAIAAARTALRPQLSELRDAVELGSTSPSAAAATAIRRAGTAYAAAFKRTFDGRLNRDDEGGRRLLAAFVSLTARRLSPDAALISSVAAFHRASGAGPAATAVPAVAARAPSGRNAGGSLITLTVSVLDVEPL
ncbi:MAG: hypothetical protein Q8L55_14335 [Phycisphaerales bacterium]|nr:hypothetical protein [Phycisphaerales bacterium]